MSANDAFTQDRYLVDQLIRPIANLYRISTLGADGASPHEPLAFVRQKKLALKEDIRFFADDSEQEELFRIKARQVFDVRGRYDVTTPDGQRFGQLEKVFGISLLRSTWRIYDEEEQQVALAQEKSMPVAVLRRAIDFVPYGEWIPIPYNFDLLMDGRVIGSLNRKFQLRDRYVLDLTGDHERKLDRRLAIALAIGLDALQNR